MANHKSAEKRSRQTVKRTERNKARTSQVRTELKKLRAAIAEGNKETATKLLVTVQSLLAKLAKSGIIKANNAARRTSRLACQVAKLS